MDLYKQLAHLRDLGLGPDRPPDAANWRAFLARRDMTFRQSCALEAIFYFNLAKDRAADISITLPAGSPQEVYA
jgi:hypothetical protein